MNKIKFLYIGKIRPQVLSIVVLLGAISIYAIFKDTMEIAAAAVGGLIAFGKDLVTKDSNGGN